MVLSPGSVALAPDSRAIVSYGLGSSLEGSSGASCNSPAVFLDQFAQPELRFETGGGEWSAHVVDYNITRVGQDTPIDQPVTSDIRTSNEQVPAGNLSVRVGANGTARILAPPAPFLLDDTTFTVDITSPQLGTGPLVTQSSTVMFYTKLETSIVPTFGRLVHPHRFVEASTGDLGIRGDLVVYLENADVRLPDGRLLATPDRVQVMARSGAPGAASVDWVREQYVFLTLHDATATLAAAGARLACEDLAAHVVGTVHAYQAQGFVERGAERIDFENRELSLTGDFSWDERRGDGGQVAASAVGHFDAAGLDFAPALDAPDALPAIIKVGFWAAVLAGLLAALYYLTKVFLGFFTRLSSDDVAGHASRRLILDAVRANPNLTLAALVAATALPASMVRYHARILESRGLLRSHRVGRNRCFVASGALRGEGRKLMDVGVPLVARHDPVVGAVAAHLTPGWTRLNPFLHVLAKDMSVSRVGAWKAVRRAEKYGLVEISRQGREVWVRCPASNS